MEPDRKDPLVGKRAGGQVEVQVFNTVESIGKNFRERFLRDLEVWVDQRPNAAGLFTLPPLLPDTSLARLVRIQRNALLLICTASVLVSAVQYWVYHHQRPWLTDLFAIFAIISGSILFDKNRHLIQIRQVFRDRKSF